MNTFMRIDINLISIILLAFVLAIAIKRIDQQDPLNRKFLRIAALILAEVTLETITCLINRQPYPFLVPVTRLLHVPLFIIGPLITYQWCYFVHYWVEGKEVEGQYRRVAFSIPLVVTSFFAATSPWTGAFYTISAMNVYVRGPLYWIPATTAYFYLIAGAGYIIQNKKYLLEHVYIPLLLFALLPMAAGYLQIRYYGLLLMWSSTAFACVILYVFIQDRMAQFDVLTGTWTKATFERYIEYRVYKERSSIPFGLIFIDLDDFKEINDSFGHLEGDFALKSAVEQIRKVLRKTDIMARFGGDEFVLMIENADYEVIRKVLDRMENVFVHYNETAAKPYQLRYSFGYEIFDASFDSIGQFLNHVDSLMYDNKKKRKASRKELRGAQSFPFQQLKED